MPFLTEEEVENGLQNPNNLANKLEVVKIKKGRPPGALTVPTEIKKVISQLANEGETQVSLANAFGIDPSSASLYERGLARTNGLPNPDLEPILDKIKRKKQDAESLAVDAMLESLEIMKPQLADVRKPSVLANIARNMAALSKELSGRSDKDGVNIAVKIYTPAMKSIDDYEIIDAG